MLFLLLPSPRLYVSERETGEGGEATRRPPPPATPTDLAYLCEARCAHCFPRIHDADPIGCALWPLCNAMPQGATGGPLLWPWRGRSLWQSSDTPLRGRLPRVGGARQRTRVASRKPGTLAAVATHRLPPSTLFPVGTSQRGASTPTLDPLHRTWNAAAGPQTRTSVLYSDCQRKASLIRHGANPRPPPLLPAGVVFA